MSDSSTTTSRSDVSERLKDRSHRAGDRSSEAPPDWDHVPFAVACARCGCDLRGLSDPKCPQCLLEFEWSDAVPIEKLTCETCGYNLYGLSETRCPECGESFTWNGALAAYHRQRIPRFEYQWRRRPVRSLIGTWFHALRPGKFWRSVDIHDPPRVGALLLMVAMILVFVFFEVAVLQGINDWLNRYVFVWGAGWGNTTPFIDLAIELPSYLAQGLIAPQPWLVLQHSSLWLLTSFLALLIFRQSMRLHKVQLRQVVRVWAHATPMALPITFLLPYGYIYSLILFDWRISGSVVGLMAAQIAIQVIWSLRCGYGLYLRMDHGLGVAIASQIVAVLAFVTIGVVVAI